MTILTCECGNEIYIMDETEATAWQCDRCGQWYDFFGVKVTPPGGAQTGEKPQSHQLERGRGAVRRQKSKK